MAGFKTLLFGAENRIARRLVVLIIAFSSGVTLLISAVQLAFEYRELRSGMDRTLDGVEIFVPGLSGNLWNFDDGQIRLSLDALKRLPTVDRVSLATPDQAQRWAAGEGSSPHVVTRTYTLRQRVRGVETEIGTLAVAASLDVIYRQVAASALTIVVGNGLKTFLVALFMVFLFRRLVTSRLEELARKAAGMGAQLLPAESGRAAPRSAPAHLDELEAVDWVMDNTSGELKRAEGLVRASLREKETLLREIHHRVKNNLQIISSLLHFHARKVKDAENVAVFQEGRDRLKSMILVHEKLYRSPSLSRIEFGGYAQALAAEIGASYRDSVSRVTLDVQSGAVHVPIEVALPLGMLLSELLTNAYKYAFPGERRGSLRVSIEETPEKLRMVVADDGVGLPPVVSTVAPAGFGMQLVANLAEQLSGEVRYRRGTGLRVEIAVPLAPADSAADARAA
jgi:two-component sensor histidine kinase